MLLFSIILLGCKSQPAIKPKIDRQAVLDRHSVTNTSMDTLSSLSIGNGKFAMTVDATGLQSFPEYYQNGVPLGTQSEWGWHAWPNEENYKMEETYKVYYAGKREVEYAINGQKEPRARAAANYYRLNPHRIHLGSLGFEFRKDNGQIANIQDITAINQNLNLYDGIVESLFKIEDISVEVKTMSSQNKDLIATEIHSSLLKDGKLKVKLQFPYPVSGWKDMGTNYQSVERHQSNIVKQTNQSVVIEHVLDSTTYYVNFNWEGTANVIKGENHTYYITPNETETFRITCEFAQKENLEIESFDQIIAQATSDMNQQWERGGIVDFEGSSDPRAFELERRVVLSQYLTKIQCGGKYPPQETGLTYNSWYGRPHLEMHWWHGVNHALWGQAEVLKNQLDWYNDIYEEAKFLASRQGYEGVRWLKMTDPNGGEGPSNVGAFLIWQQPHIIYMAETLYRISGDKDILEKYKDLVFATADFMVDYPSYDEDKSRYILGPNLISAQERFIPEDTYNPAYELTYWHLTLGMAEDWRARLNLKPIEKWQNVKDSLSHFTEVDGKYLFAESAFDSYSNKVYRADHPAIIGIMGMFPPEQFLDKETFKNTWDWVWENWAWEDTWGWDFPLAAMTATRLGQPERAIDALFMPVQTNTYLKNGHNYQDGRLTIYLPGNGGLMTAVAMMCAGFEGSSEENPGIPKDGTWKVKWEGLNKYL